MIVYILSFVLAAGLGAYGRYQAVILIPHPWGVFFVNLLGSFLVGLLAVLLARYTPEVLPEAFKTVVLVAFLGSLTTFSSYALEITTYLEEGMPLKAMSYFVISNALCVAGCFLGWRLAQSI